MDEYKAESGEFFRNFVKRVQESMWRLNQNYAIGIFNNIRVPIHDDSNIDDICVIYELKRKLE